MTAVCPVTLSDSENNKCISCAFLYSAALSSYLSSYKCIIRNKSCEMSPYIKDAQENFEKLSKQDWSNVVFYEN